MEYTKLFMLLCIGIAAGYLSGFVGIGGGIVMVPALVLFLGLTQFQAQGTSLAVLAIPVAAFGAYNYFKQGYINLTFAAIIAIGFVLGAFLGAKTVLKLDPVLVKKIFGFIMIAIALKFISGK
jgi:uncharacterized membrane protein YfcA